MSANDTPSSPSSATSPKDSSSVASLREELVSTAVKFLQNPKVQTSPKAKRMAFLEQKGLTQAEIAEAFLRAGPDVAPSSSSSTQVESIMTASPSLPPPVPTHMQQPRRLQMEPAPLRWKDYALATAVFAGISYGGYLAFQKYVAPLVSWRPWGSSDESHSRTEEQLQGLEDDVKVLCETVGQVSQSLKQLIELEHSKEVKSEEVISSLTAEMSALKALIPATMGAQSANEAALSDLRSELSTVKGLLLNRKQFAMTSPVGNGNGAHVNGTTPTSTSLPQWQKNMYRQFSDQETVEKTPEKANAISYASAVSGKAEDSSVTNSVASTSETISPATIATVAENDKS